MPSNSGNIARNQLSAIERRRQLAVVSEFEKIRRRLFVDLADILKQIDHLRRTEGNALPSLIFRKTRIQELLDVVTDEINAASVRLGIITEGAQKQAIEIGKRQAAKFPELAANLGFFDSPATQKLIGIASNGAPLDVHFKTIAPSIRSAMFDALFYGIATGTPNPEIARDVRQAIGGGTARAMMIVRTETNRAYREASREFYDETKAVKGWQWLSALDLRTCVICWALHGSIFSTKTPFATHPQCRCTLVPVFEGDATVETGPERFAKLTDAQKKAILGPRRLELYQQGAELKDFVGDTESVFGKGRRIKSLDNTTFEAKPRDGLPSATPEPARPSGTPKPALPAIAQVIDIRPGDPVPLFAGPADAIEYMERRYPAIKFDFERMHPANINANAREMTRLLDLYPETAERLKYAGTYFDRGKIVGGLGYGKFPNGEIAHATMTGRYMAWNPNYYRFAGKVEKTLKEQKGTGFLASDNPVSATTHEFGHLVDSWLKSIDKNGESLFKFRYHDNRASLRQIRQKMLTDLRPEPGELSNYALSAAKGRKNQQAEQFAEAFSDAEHNPAAGWSKYTRAQKLFIEAVRSRPRYSVFDQVDYDSLTPDEKRAAQAELKEFLKSLGLE